MDLFFLYMLNVNQVSGKNPSGRVTGTFPWLGCYRLRRTSSVGAEQPLPCLVQCVCALGRVMQR